MSERAADFNPLTVRGREFNPLQLGGTQYASVICAAFVYCHCTGRWAVLDNTLGKDSGAFRQGLWYSHYHGPYSP